MKKSPAIVMMALAALILASCGGESIPSDNPPKVSGQYGCISSCSGKCVFGNISVSQTGSTVIAVTAVNTCTGNIDNNGNYSADCKGSLATTGNCDGDFAGNIFTASCTFNGTSCQTATYQKQ